MLSSIFWSFLLVIGILLRDYLLAIADAIAGLSF
jgi:hypothetical protein